MESLNSLTDLALSYVASYGVWILLLVSFVGSLGIPFPITPVIIAAGALTHDGSIPWELAVLACLAGAALADNSEYALGHWAKGWLERRFSHQAAWKRGFNILNRQGGWAIFLTRFWLMPLAPAVNVIAGNRYPYRRFLFFDVAGQLLWVLFYGGLGYFFASQWKLVSQTVSNISVLSFAAAVLFIVVFFLFRFLRKHWPFGKAHVILPVVSADLLLPAKPVASQLYKK